MVAPVMRQPLVYKRQEISVERTFATALNGFGNLDGLISVMHQPLVYKRQEIFLGRTFAMALNGPGNVVGRPLQ